MLKRGLAMKTLIIKLTAPLQSYGNQATFNRRTSNYYPTKSAIIGMIAAALGLRREDKKIKELNNLKVAVRIDQPGQTLTDFQIVEYDQKKHKRSLSYRDYLQDAVFVVAVESDDEQIDQIYHALSHPRFQLYLGRRSNAPAGPLMMKLFNDQDPVSVLRHCDWQASDWYQERLHKEQFSAEIIADASLTSDQRTELIKDQVGSFSQKHRWHSYRAVTTCHVSLKNKCYKGTEHDIMAQLP